MSLLLWYPFTKHGRNQGILPATNFSTTFFDCGKLGRCALTTSLNTSDTGIHLLDHWNLLENSVSMSCWVKFNQAEIATLLNSLTYDASHYAPTGGILGYGYYGGLAIHWLANNMFADDKKLPFESLRIFGCVRGFNSSGSAVLPIQGYYTVPFDTWIHLAYVCDIKTKIATLYINGEKFAQNSFSSLASWNNTGNFHIGGQMVYSGNGPTVRLPFSINDVRLYDNALSINEIKELSRGLVFHYTFNDPLLEKTVNLIGDYVIDTSKLTMNFTAVKNNGKTTITSTSPNSGTSGQIRWHFPLAILTNGQSYYFSCKYRIISGSGGISFTDWCDVALQDKKIIEHDDYFYFSAKCPSRESGYDSTYRFLDMSIDQNSIVEFWDMQLQTNAYATPYTKYSRELQCTDESGNGYGADQINMTYSTDTTIGVGAAKFNGLTSCLEVPHIRSDLFKTPYTLNLWVYPDDSGRAILFGDHQLTGGVSMNFELKNGGELRYYHGGSPDKTFTKTIIAPGKWTMITLTYDGTKLVAYLNGTKTEEYQFQATITKSSGVMRIGRDNRDDATALGGRIGDFRWYATALTDQDIEYLYQSRVGIDNKDNVFTNCIIEQNQYSNMVNENSWEQNGIIDASGANAEDMLNRLRTKYIPVLPNTTYYCQVGENYVVRTVHCYDSEYKWISGIFYGNMATFTTPTNCAYVRWVLQHNDSSSSVLEESVANFWPRMSCTPYDNAIKMNTLMQGTSINTKYILQTKDICENHTAAFFKDGTATANVFIEI